MRSAHTKHLSDRLNLGAHFVAIIVAAHAIYIVANTLVNQIAVFKHPRLSSTDVDIHILLGISLIYLSTLLLRRKRTAWLVTIIVYAFYLGLGATQLLRHLSQHTVAPSEQITALLLPTLVLALLLAFHKQFIVKSDIRGFRSAMRFVLVMFIAATLYGVAGFELMDTSDFHQEIGWPEALHYTLDQFDITVSKPVQAYTQRAKLFMDSLSFISAIAAF
jgi:hypothetical protein